MQHLLNFLDIPIPETRIWASLENEPRTLAIELLSRLIVQAIRRESSWRALAAGSLVVVAARFAGARLGGESPWFWQWHGPLAADACALTDARLAALWFFGTTAVRHWWLTFDALSVAVTTTR